MKILNSEKRRPVWPKLRSFSDSAPQNYPDKTALIKMARYFVGLLLINPPVESLDGMECFRFEENITLTSDILKP